MACQHFRFFGWASPTSRSTNRRQARHRLWPQSSLQMKISHEGIRTREEPLYPPGPLPPNAIVPHRFEGIMVGELMGPVEYTVKPATHEKSCAVLELSHPWFVERSPWGGVVLLPCETWCQSICRSLFCRQANSPREYLLRSSKKIP